VSKTILHISDLHFGRVDSALPAALVHSINRISPDIVAVSGDLTQHAWPTEFEQAAKFLRQLPGIQIVVPGNHDMAFLNPVRRITQRLALFRKFISHNLEPFYHDGEVAIMGLNTARVTHLRHGRIRDWQIDILQERMSTISRSTLKILVTHHPFDLPQASDPRNIVGHGRRLIERVVCCIDLMLAGHMHISHSAPTAQRYKVEGQSAVFVQAGTAISTRGRGEPNAFQVIRTATAAIEVETHAWCGTDAAFLPATKRLFTETTSGWRAASEQTGPAAGQVAYTPPEVTV
jgi:3',5'-cyclic AMP phosphodiesterase CpdA